MDEPRAWWEWILLGVIVVGTVVAIVGVRRAKQYKRQFPQPPKPRPPGGRA